MIDRTVPTALAPLKHAVENGRRILYGYHSLVGTAQMRLTPPPVDDIDTLFSLAAAMEREAARRYAELAEEVRSVGHDDVAEVFEELAREEASHETGIADWSRRETGSAPKEGDYSWDMGSEVLVPDEESEADPYTLTPYRALSIAVHNEERAFAFYSYLAAELADPELRRYAEHLAREELEHAARLRALRRRAYHAERGGRTREQTEIAARTPRDIRAFHDLAGRLEAWLAANMAALAERMRTDGDGAAADKISGLATESGDAARRMGVSDGERAEVEESWRLRDALSELEGAYEFYARIADTAQSEEMVGAAQEMMSSAISRLARLRDIVASARERAATTS